MSQLVYFRKNQTNFFSILLLSCSSSDLCRYEVWYPNWYARPTRVSALLSWFVNALKPIRLCHFPPRRAETVSRDRKFADIMDWKSFVPFLKKLKMVQWWDLRESVGNEFLSCPKSRNFRFLYFKGTAVARSAAPQNTSIFELLLYSCTAGAILRLLSPFFY